MKKICLFAGTTEGRRLAEALHESYDLTVCVATEYGEVLLDGIDDIALHTGRMDSEQMTAFFNQNSFELIIDATHPYAVLVTENIRAAAAEAGIEYMRILRDCGAGTLFKGAEHRRAARDRRKVAGHEGFGQERRLLRKAERGRSGRRKGDCNRRAQAGRRNFARSRARRAPAGTYYYD